MRLTFLKNVNNKKNILHKTKSNWIHFEIRSVKYLKFIFPSTIKTVHQCVCECKTARDSKTIYHSTFSRFSPFSPQKTWLDHTKKPHCI